MTLKADLVFIYYNVKTESIESEQDMLQLQICLRKNFFLLLSFIKIDQQCHQSRGVVIPHHRRHINPWHPGRTQVNQQYI